MEQALDQSLAAPAAEPGILPGGLNLDASKLDDNLKAIRQTEGTWRLPPLPTEVSLDLAAHPALNPAGITSFLTSLEKDLHGQADPTAQVQAAPQIPTFNVINRVTPFSEQQQSGFEKFSQGLLSLRGLPQSETLDANATQRFKMRAIERGFMDAPQDGNIDGSWSPELETIRRDMAYSDYDKKLRGDRFGAMPVTGEHGVLKLLNDWTSPSGLLRAAVNLDLWWDTGQISKEISSWGDKWHKVGKSHGLLDFGKNLIDAMTGPIDDIAVPILNMALLFSGVGAGTNFARLGMTGLHGLEAAEAFRGAESLYKIPGAGRLIEGIFPSLAGAGEAEKAARGLGEASLLANRLKKTEHFAALGRGMEGWRGTDLSIVGRRAVQTGTRLGFVSQAEDLLPNYHGRALGDVSGVAAGADSIFKNPITTTAFEWLFTPYAMFEPGTFSGAARKARGASFHFLGTAPGRGAAGALVGAGAGAYEGDSTAGVLGGAALGAGLAAATPLLGAGLKRISATDVPVYTKLVGGVGDFLQLSSFKPIAQEQKVSGMFFEAMRRNLPEDKFAEFQDNVRRGGLLKALADHHGTDEEGAGAAMGFVTTMGAIDHTASQQAGTLGSKGWEQRYFLARNKLIAQIRVHDPATATKESVVWNIVSKEMNVKRGMAHRFEDGMARFKDDNLAELIGLHNEQAHATLSQLISSENLPTDEKMTQYISTAMQNFGDWGKYTANTTALRGHIGTGLFDGASLIEPQSVSGRVLKSLDGLENYVPPDAAKVDWFQEATDQLTLEEGAAANYRKAKGYFNPMAREIDPNLSRFTLARAETLTKHQLIEVGDQIQAVQDMAEAWRRASTLTDSAGDALHTVVKLGDGGISETELNQLLRTAGVSKSTQAKAARRLNRLTRDAGLTVDQGFESALHKYIDQFSQDAKWQDTFNLDPIVRNRDDQVLGGLDKLKAYQKSISRKAHYTASEVNMDGMVAKLREQGELAKAQQIEDFANHAAGQGYKVVYGSDFMAPDELLHRTGVFADINARHLNAMTLGNFFGRRQPEELAAKTNRYRQIAVSRELSNALGRDVAPQDPMVVQAVSDLRDFVLRTDTTLNHGMVDDVAHRGWLARRGAAFHNADMPQSMTALGLGKHRGQVVSKLTQLGYDEREAAAVWQGLKASRFSDWHDQGLYAIEAKMRQHNQILDGLHFFSATDEANRLKAGKFVKSELASAAVGAVAAAASGNDVATGAAVGAGVGLGAGQVAGRAAEAMDYSKWARYGYLADNLAAFRDKMRFTLSPFFDVARYSHSFMLGQTAAPLRDAQGLRIGIPLNSSPSKLKKLIGEGRFAERTAEMRAASKGVFDPSTIDGADNWFRELGVLGYNPTNWMTSTFHHLREEGLDPEAAWNGVQNVYHYGTTGRSAAEQSVNFIFFPFSFQKKVLTATSKWLADDMMRGVLLHDAYRSYELLNQKYDLGQLMKDHAPVLQNLERLNSFAFGLSPGKLGGLNAPILNALVGDPTSGEQDHHGVLNLFSPQGVHVDASSIGMLKDTVTKMIPAMNDVHYMLDDAKQQQHVFFSASHQTERADTQDGYGQWNEFKKGVNAALKQQGASFQDMFSKPYLKPLLDSYQQKKLELEEKYPGWVQSKVTAQGKQAELGQERTHRVNTVAYRPQEATLTDKQFVQMEEHLKAWKDFYATSGITDTADFPPEFFDQMKGVAIDMAAQNPSFLAVYKKYYSSFLGELTGPKYG